MANSNQFSNRNKKFSRDRDTRNEEQPENSRDEVKGKKNFY